MGREIKRNNSPDRILTRVSIILLIIIIIINIIINEVFL